MTNKKKVVIGTLLTLLPVLIGLLLWNKLPERIPTHFDVNGVADSYSSRLFTVVGLPVFLAGVEMLVGFMTISDPKQKNINRKMFNIGIFTVPVISIIMMSSIYALALGYHVNIASITFIAIGLLFIVIGNYLPKTKQNYTVGIKIPWALNSSENWNRTHRLASRLFIVAGLLIIANIWLKSFVLFITVVLVIIFVPIVYSYILYKKGI